MTFKAGQSGNPAGRPKGSGTSSLQLIELAREYGPAAVRRLAYWMESDDAKASTFAATALLDRGFGKPKQETELTGKDGAPLMPSLNITMATLNALPAPKEIVVIEEGKGE